MSTAIPVFYTPKMVAPNTSGSPSAAKPLAVVESWRHLGVPLAFMEPAPASVEELCRAHDAAFVKGVLAGAITNGFGNRRLDVAMSLPFTTGALLDAARHVLRHGLPVAVAPCSGFHHAEYAEAAAYCTFNGLMVAAACLRAEGLAQRVGILDCDMHYGNGTDDIIEKLSAASWVEHYTAGKSLCLLEDALAYLPALSLALEDMRGCDVVLYQAGADPHVDDPLGGMLTTDEMRRRDALVFDTLHAMKIPVVWNLAGGYQTEKDGSIPKVLELHDNTMRECARVFAAA